MVFKMMYSIFKYLMEISVILVEDLFYYCGFKNHIFVLKIISFGILRVFLK